MTKKEYDTFCDNPERLSEGEVTIAIRELNTEDRRKKYLTRYVKAIISPNPNKFPNILYLRWHRGRLHPKPWGIKIIEELGEFLPK